LVPSIKKTWAPRGKTPILTTAGRWTKISAISAISVSVKRKHLVLYARFHPNKNICNTDVARFLRQLLKHLRGHLVLLWDSGAIHKGAAITEVLERYPRLHTERFPGYAPELNPDEFVWNNLKGALANSVPKDTHHLRQLLAPPLRRLRQSQKLLWSCIYASELPWP